MTLNAYDPIAKVIADTGKVIFGGDITRAISDAVAGGGASYTFGPGLSNASGTVSITFGTIANTVAAGNDSRIVGALQATAIPAASGQILGASGTAGQAVAIALGAGLAIQSGSLVCTVTGAGTYTLPAATTSALGGVKGDGQTVTIANDGTLSINIVAATALTDIATLGGPSGTDIGVINRSGTDYKVTFTAQAALFRKTPAGSRTVTLATGSTTATLTAADHDKTVVVAGIAGTLAVDGTITDGFQCRVINHTGSALVYSGITGLQSSTSLPNNAATVVTLSNATVEASASAASGGVTTFNTRAGAITLTLSDVTAVTGTGATAKTNLGLANVASSGAYSDLSGAPTIPAASSATPIVDGTGAAGTSATYARSDHVHPTDATRLAAASNLSDLANAATARTNLGLATVAASGAYTDLTGRPSLGTLAPLNLGTGFVNSSGTISVPASFSAAIAGVVGSLPGGAGAVVTRYPFERPGSLATNLASPYGPQGYVGTQPSATASFGLSKRTAAGTTTSIGSISISTAGAVSASVTATSFAAGDFLILTAPSPADSTLADINLKFTGAWS